MGPVVVGRTRTLVTVAVYVALAVAAAVNGARLLDHVDEPIERFVAEHRTPWLDDVMGTITHAGAIVVALAGGALLAAAAWSRDRRLAALVVAVTLACPIVQGGLKAAVGRERPALAPLVDVDSSSFPSGHAMTAAALWVLVPAVWARWSGWGQLLVTAVAWSIVAAVAVSRVYLGVHWATDAIGGVLAGIGLVGALDALVLTRGRGSGAASRPPC